jgi:hypothetical protein
VSVPAHIHEWSRVAHQYESAEEQINSNLSEIVINFTNLRASMAGFRDFSNSAAIVSAALQIDSDLAAWATECPLHYVYNTITMKERSESVFADYYHVYPNIWIATTWNHYRSIRMLVNELILEHLSHLNQNQFVYQDPGQDFSILYENRMLFSKSVLVQMTQDICASVPYYLNYQDPGRTDDPINNPPKAAGGNLLLWPLYTAAVTEVVSDVMRSWVVGRLKAIAEIMGIRQATALAHVLSLKKEIDVWEVEDLEYPLDVTVDDTW